MTTTFKEPLLRTGSGSLSREQVAHYDREGYLVLGDFLSEQELAPCRAAMNARVDFIAGELLQNGLIQDKFENEPFKYRLAKMFADLTDQDFLKYGRSWRDRHEGYFDLLSNVKILDAVESLIGPEIFSNPVYNTRPKVPKVAAGAVPWHQDKSYWPNANSNPVITVWIPLLDATLENGCLHIIPGTHRKRMIEHGTESYSGTSYTETNPDAVAAMRRKREILPLPVTAGSAILFNDRLLHMSTPNNSDHVRWSVDLRYQPTDQDPMPEYGLGFLARSRAQPGRVTTLADWLADRTEHGEAG